MISLTEGRRELYLKFFIRSLCLNTYSTSEVKDFTAVEQRQYFVVRPSINDFLAISYIKIDHCNYIKTCGVNTALCYLKKK